MFNSHNSGSNLNWITATDVLEICILFARNERGAIFVDAW